MICGDVLLTVTMCKVLRSYLEGVFGGGCCVLPDSADLGGNGQAVGSEHADVGCVDVHSDHRGAVLFGGVINDQCPEGNTQTRLFDLETGCVLVE